MDKTDKQMILLMVAVLIVVVFLGFIVNTFLAPTFKGTPITNSTINNAVSKLDSKNHYLAKFSTSVGDFTVSLDTKSAPNYTSIFATNANNNYYDGSKFYGYDQGMGVLLGRNQNGETQGNLFDEFNSSSLNLQNDKVSSIFDQLKSHKDNLYKDSDVDSNMNMSLKDFNEKFLGVKYSTHVTSSKIQKYSLIASVLGNTGTTEMIITTTNTNRYLDGRRLHIGDVISGTEIIDKIIASPVNSVTIKSVQVNKQ